MAAMAFQYLEIRPCIDQGGNVTSFTDEAEFDRECNMLTDAEWNYSSFWSLYGVYPLNVGADAVAPLESALIGDFDSKASAFVIMNAMLAPLATARDLIRARDSQLDASRAADALDDFINQSSNDERL